jgi:hypothetical protein
MLILGQATTGPPTFVKILILRIKLVQVRRYVCSVRTKTERVDAGKVRSPKEHVFSIKILSKYININCLLIITELDNRIYLVDAFH